MANRWDAKITRYIKDPNGIIHQVKNVKEFCQEQGITTEPIYQLIKPSKTKRGFYTQNKMGYELSTAYDYFKQQETLINK